MRMLSLLAAAFVTACGPSGERTPRTDAEPAEEPVTIQPWPFTVAWVDLTCEAPSKVFATAPDGRRFAVNGAARSDAPLMTDIQAYYDTAGLIQRGLSLCRDHSGPLRLTAPAQVAQAPEQVPRDNAFSVEASRLGGITATALSETVVDGSRPEVSFACEGGRATFLFLDLQRAPQTPPPLRGVYGSFRIDDGTPQRVELSWAGTGGQWSLRSDDDHSVEARLVPAILAGQRLVFEGPAGFTSGEPVEWAMSGFGERMAAVREACG